MSIRKLLAPHSIDVSKIRDLESRLRCLVEVCDRIDDHRQGLDLKFLLDEIELDAWSSAGSPDLEGRVITSWLINVSFSKDIDVDMIRSNMGDDVLAQIENLGGVSFIAWLKSFSVVLRSSVENTFGAGDFYELVSNLMAINLLTLQLLFQIGRYRVGFFEHEST